ncbi:DUF6528 family protein [uncultured Muribaculum sp.]|uniref:DUF6528 family protein n=1 Tax=uncultured Muribaculum sp. TaxID=1918613 RepID=UPI0025D629E2|nr:DUF6528 family protein [uncultured Muribaculum sp.]
MIINFLVGACLAFSATACSDDDDKDFNAVTERAAKVNIGFNRYIDANGAFTQLKWNAGDKAILRLASDGSSYTATPIRPGQTSSLFLFTVKAPGAATVVSYWPVDAPVTVGAGKVEFDIPATQNGTITPLLLGHDRQALSSYEGCDISLSQFSALMMVNVARGNYSVESVEVRANGGENIAGHITIDADTWAINASEPSVRVTLPTAADCTLDGIKVALQLAPVSLSAGYTITVNTSAGHSFNVVSNDPAKLMSGEILYTSDASDSEPPHLLIGGTDKVHIINVAQCMGGSYKSGLEWTWNAEDAAKTLDVAASRCDHIDDCKPVENGSKILVTSSYNWCVLLERETKNILFHTTQAANAHSAELLPGNRIVVACSDGSSSNHHQVQLYDIAKPNTVLQRYTLQYAHGVVWSENNKRLYAAGHNQLQVYSLLDWDTENPQLKLEKTINTPQGSVHDITLADANTLVVAGVKAYLFDMNTESFTEMPLFAASTQIKSLNYNPATSELWYTDATKPEGTQSWSTQTLRYSTDYTASKETSTIKVPDMDVYKVRVLNW